jgi:hypothetical protein
MLDGLARALIAEPPIAPANESVLKRQAQ